MLDEECHVGGWGPAKRRLADDLAVNDGPVVVRAVTVVVNPRRGIERTRRGELCQGAGRDVVRQAVAERNDRAMTLIDHTWSTFDLAEPGDDALVRVDAVAVRFAGV